MIDEPRRPLEYSTIKIVIRSSEYGYNRTTTIETKVHNNGSRPDSDNWVVSWYENTVEIIIMDEVPRDERFNVRLE